VRLAFSEELATICLDDGQVNAIGEAQLDELEQTLSLLEAAPRPALLSFAQGRSPKGTPLFCAGANLKERAAWSAARIDKHVRRQRLLLARLSSLPLLHVTLIDGACLGFGVEWLLAADYGIATQRARFACPELRLGIIPGAGGSALLAQRIGTAHAQRLVITGEFIDGAEAVRLGLCQELCSSFDEGLERAKKLCSASAECPPLARRVFACAQRQMEAPERARRLGIEADAYSECLGIVPAPTPAPPRASPVLGLLTDFGQGDAYVGAMKGVAASICAGVCIHDLSHDIPPQDVEHGAQVLAQLVRFWPRAAALVAVVDPGVGSKRRALAVRVDGRLLLGPDNGLLALAIDALDATPELIDISDSPYALPQRSATFDGRDLFTPVAAHWLAGVPFEALGAPCDSFRRLPLLLAQREGARIRARIRHIDHFGNLISNLPADWLPSRFRVSDAKGQALVSGPSRSYSEAQRGELLALRGSSGELELAVNCGSAARLTGLQRGDELIVEES
jgi:S-adenosylmethionine hydrolase/enoyl-CoA hydratase/carnithine racemase